MQRRSVLVALAAAAAAVTPVMITAAAAPPTAFTTWLIPGGTWQDAASWSSGVPGPDTEAVFDLAQSYVVQFDAAPPADVNQVRFRQELATLSLNGQTLNVLNDVTGGETSNGVDLTIDGGRLNVGRSLYIGGTATAQFSSGALRLPAGASLNVAETLRLYGGFLTVSGGSLRTHSLSVGTNFNPTFTSGTITVSGGTLGAIRGWNIGSPAGSSAVPTMRLENGATATSVNAAMNVGMSGRGQLDIDGAILTDSSNLGFVSIGTGTAPGGVSRGIGTLSVSNGAVVDRISLAIGDLGGTGVARFDGPGTSWSCNQYLRVGSNGLEADGTYYTSDGSLSIANGARVTVTGASVDFGGGGSKAVVTIDGAGSKLDSTAAISPLGLGGNRTLNNQVYRGEGTLTITDGGVLHHGGRLSLGGWVSVDGPGSKLVSNGTIALSRARNDPLPGMLLATKGAQVIAAGDAWFGASAGVGSALFSHATLTVGGELRAGFSRTSVGSIQFLPDGTLTVTDQSSVTSQSMQIAGGLGRGTMIFDGPGVTWTNTADAKVGDYRNAASFRGEGTLIIKNGATASIGGLLSVTPDGLVDLSEHAAVTAGGLSMQGGLVSVPSPTSLTTTGNSSIGTAPTETARVVVSGPQSSWVGTGATSNTAIGAGGVGSFGAGGIGSMTIDQGALCNPAGSLSVAATGTQSVGQVLITDPGTRMLVGGSVDVGGQGGSGTLTLTNDATVSIAGTLRVGPNGLVDVSTNIALPAAAVAMSGGQLIIHSPATFTTTGNGSIGTGTTSGANMLVSGPSAAWRSTGATAINGIGAQGIGSLTIDQGALFDAAGTVTLGSTSTASAGSVLVTGFGSRLAIGTWLDFAAQGKGTLILADGARVTTPAARAGLSNGSAATILLNGGGSTMDVAGTLAVGNSTGASARLFLNNDSTLTVGNTLTAGNGGTVLLNGGSLVAPKIWATGSGRVVVPTGSNQLLRTGVGTTSSGGVIDLNDNHARFTATPYSSVAAQIASARGNGAWTGGGISSSVAKANPKRSTTLGTLRGDEYVLLYGADTSFYGDVVAAADTLVKYTYYGDTDFSGRVDFSDYVRIDTGFNTGLTGWLNGDFNYSGSVTFDDYVLIDVAFNQQSGTLQRAVGWISGDDRAWSDPSGASTAVHEVIAHFGQFGTRFGAAFLAAIPEPAAMTLTAPLAGMLLRRRRRHRRRTHIEG